MKHLLKKLSFSGGKKKPKPKPAQLAPPILGNIQLAASFSYAELLDLVSDGPIAGLVNENGLLLSSKDILQGVYLNDTAIAVSNDKVVEQAPPLINSSVGITSSTIMSTFSQVFKNLQKSDIYYPSSIPQNYKVINSLINYLASSVYFGGAPTPNYSQNDSVYTQGTTLAKAGVRWFFRNNNNQLNTLSDSSSESAYFSPTSEQIFTNTLIEQYLISLFAHYDDSTTNTYEKTYLKNMFDRNFSSGWATLPRATVISNFLTTIKGSGQSVKYIINVPKNQTTVFFTKDKPILNTKKYKFSIFNTVGESIEDKNLKIYDLLLPRIEIKSGATSGTTTGAAFGFIVVRISAATSYYETIKKEYSGRQQIEYRYGNKAFSIPEFIINELANTSFLNLNDVSTVVQNNVEVQKYNYSNILAEYRAGDEYQAPLKYFNSVLIDKDYSSPLLGPFRINQPVQRILESAQMIDLGNTLNFPNPWTDGSVDDGRLSTQIKNYSNWDKNINSYNENAIPVTHIINNPNITSVFITIQVNALSDTLTVDIARAGLTTLPAGMNYASILNILVETGTIDQKGIETKTSQRGFKIVALIQSPTLIDIGNPDLAAFSTNEYKFISEYSGSYDFSPLSTNASIFEPFPLSPTSPTVAKRFVRITKLSSETNSSLLQKECLLSKVTEIIPQNFSYPNSAIVATKIDSRSFGSIPTRTFDCKLKKVRVPSNYFPLLSNGKDKRYYSSELTFNQTKTSDKSIYNGDWDGQFKIDSVTKEYILEWTDNPAWILLDLITNQRYGLGQYMDDSQIDIFDLYKIARFCDAVDDFGYFQGVPDGQGGLEPRFSCNILFQQNTKIFDCLNIIAALFRGIIYYNNSQINFVDDRPKEPIALFSNTNIKDGIFNYSNYRRDEQFNSIEVIYVDRFENYLTKIEYVEDEEDIRKRGIFKKTINADGVTSRAMARRLGKHLIFQTIKENQSLNFSAGLEALLCKPGDLIIVEDELKNLKSNFGKVLSVNSQSKSIRLNEKFIDGEFDNRLTVYTPTGYSTNDEILEKASLVRNRIIGSGFYLNSGNLPLANYPYLTGNYIFSKYTDGYTGEVVAPKQNQYAFYTGSNSKFCYFSTGFTGWVLGTGVPFSDNNLYSKIIFATGDSLFTQVNRGSYNLYNTSVPNRRSGSLTSGNKINETTGAKSLFRDVSGSLQITRGLLDSDIILSSPSQITTFDISGVVQYDYGCEVFVNSSDINYSLVPFVKEGSIYRFQRVVADDQIYKVISIKEENINEYSVICTKFDTGKYNLIENDKSIEYKSNTYSYTVSQKIGNTNYKVLNSPNIQQLVTGLDGSSQFYISGNWKQVLDNKGYNVSLKNSQGVVESQVLLVNETGAAFNVNGIGNYSFRVSAIGSTPNSNNNNPNFYTDSDYSESGIFLVYEDGNLLNYDRPYLSSLVVL